MITANRFHFLNFNGTWSQVFFLLQLHAHICEQSEIANKI